MSYKRRQQKIARMHEFYEPSDSGNEVAYSGEVDTLFYDPAFPGPREIRILDSSNYRTFTSDPYNQNTIDWAVGGISGQTMAVGSTGVTDPSTVDAHDFRGMMAVVRRMPDTNYGPVATSDHNSILSLLYQMQESSHYFPNEVSQADVLKAV